MAVLKWRIGAVALLLMLAGCGAAVSNAPAAAPASPTDPVSSPSSTFAPADTPPPAPTPAPTPVPTAVPTAQPTPVPTQAPVAKAPTAAPDTCGAPSNPWGYGFCSGSTISGPPSSFCSYFACIASFWNGRGYVEQCGDGSYSKSGGIQGSCSQHGGNRRPLYQP
jgi:hypothetical protein